MTPAMTPEVPEVPSDAELMNELWTLMVTTMSAEPASLAAKQR